LMAYWLFLLLNGVLLIRPEELFPEIEGLRLYLIVICSCIVASAPQLIERLQPQQLAERPITVCVLGIWSASVLSLLVRGQLSEATDFGSDYGKVILYYLLFVSIIDTPAKLKSFLGWLVVIVGILTALALLQFFGYIDIAALTPLDRTEHGEDGEVSVLAQLRSCGIYNDPNDLCLILVTGSLCALARAATAGDVLGRLAWAAPIGVFGYAVTLTQSRGGLLGLMVAVISWLWGRLGWKKALPLGVVVVPAMFMMAGGRQANMNLGANDTANHRAALWSDGFMAMKRNLFTGIGAGEYAGECGLVAHNSFVHAYVELGLLGGALYLGAFSLAVVSTHQSRPADPLLARLRPFVLAVVVGYAGGTFTLSRNYVIPTYLVIGLADAYLRIAHPYSPPSHRVDGRLMIWLVKLGVAGFLVLRLVTQVLLSLG
jgi:putative inorganic carbon (HCO3(-)) transporter